VLARVFSCAVVGLDGVVVEVEVDTRRGLPKVVIVGLPDAAVQESRERVHAAVRNSGHEFPRGHVTINLAPASVRKAGPAYDLPIAIGVLVAGGFLPPDSVEDTLIVGELSLDGTLRHVRGVLPMAATARAEGFERLIVPAVDAAEAALIPDLEIIPAESIQSVIGYLRGFEKIPSVPFVEPVNGLAPGQTDFAEIKGQEHVKRAMEVAAGGGHNVMMSGPPGAGKTLVARSLPGILPELEIDEALDVTRIYSIADQLPADTPLMRRRPFRAPHHTISHAGLVGGGNWPQPGEISLAHRGVLFLDELPEFGSRVLEVMRQPMEDKVVTISRASGSLTFPANFQLVAAMNPCPCGYHGDSQRQCTCSPGTVAKYQKRISGPLLDRVDIHIDVPRVDYEKLSDDRLGETSQCVRDRVEAARDRQRRRFEGTARATNADMGPGEVRKFCRLDDAGVALMRAAMAKLQLSARAYHRVLKLARTIADLAGEDEITAACVAEAVQYRSRMNGIGAG
jgi:magnesium chelatase family protein